MFSELESRHAREDAKSPERPSADPTPAAPDPQHVCDAKNIGINPPGALHVCTLPASHKGWHQCAEWHGDVMCSHTWPPVGITFDPPPP